MYPVQPNAHMADKTTRPYNLFSADLTICLPLQPNLNFIGCGTWRLLAYGARKPTFAFIRRNPLYKAPLDYFCRIRASGFQQPRLNIALAVGSVDGCCLLASRPVRKLLTIS